jgi:cardiolipin synthase A/B
MIQMLRDVQVYLTRDNRLGAYTNGYDLYHDLFDAIQSASHHIHIEIYIIRNDETGRRFISALAERARDGLEVRLLYDDVGGLKLPPGFFDEILSAGGSVANFLPSLIPRINLRANFRNHRKIAVFDGDTGFVGGYNIGDEYLGKDKTKGFWRDTHLKVQGSAVFSLQLQFIEDWNFSVKEKLVIQPQYFPSPRITGTAPVQVASGGPDTKWNKIKDALLRMIYGAEESIYIQSPYFIPDMSTFDALRVASLSGVDVRLIIPNKPDHPFVHWASRSYAGELMDAGVRTYIYENGFIHSKMVVVDGSVATIGSANWDIRSFKLNFETNAFIYDQRFANTLKEIFLLDLEHCVELTHDVYARRSVFIRMKESVSRLLSPIL